MRLRNRKTERECSCASKRLKINARATKRVRRVQVVLALLHFAIWVFQEVSVNSFFPVTPFLMAIQVVTGLPMPVRRPVTGFVTGLLMLVHSYSHFVLLLDT